MKNEQDVQCFDQLGVGLEGALIQTVHHVQEVLDVAKSLGGLVERPADPVAVCGRGDCGDAADDAVDLLVHLQDVLVRVEAWEQGWVLLRLECAHGSHRADQDSHRVGVVVEALHHPGDVSVDVGVVHDLVLPVGKLRFCWQLAEYQEKSDFEES